MLPLRNSKGEISLILAISHRLRPADRDYVGGFSSLGISEFVFMDIGNGVPGARGIGLSGEVDRAASYNHEPAPCVWRGHGHRP